GLGRAVHAQRVVVVRAVDVAHALATAGPLEAERLDAAVVVLDQEGESVDLDGGAGRDPQLLHRVERVPDDLWSVHVNGHGAFPFVRCGSCLSGQRGSRTPGTGGDPSGLAVALPG